MYRHPDLFVFFFLKYAVLNMGIYSDICVEIRDRHLDLFLFFLNEYAVLNIQIYSHDFWLNGRNRSEWPDLVDIQVCIWKAVNSFFKFLPQECEFNSQAGSARWW